MGKRIATPLYVGHFIEKGASLLKLACMLVLCLLLNVAGLGLCANRFSPDLQALRREAKILEQTRALSMSQLQRETAEKLRDRTRRYVNYLDLRLSNLCSKIIQIGGQDAIADLECPSPESFIPGWQIPAAKTREERIEDLDKQLTEELGRFDDMLAIEQEKIASVRHGPSTKHGGEYQASDRASTNPGKILQDRAKEDSHDNPYEPENSDEKKVPDNSSDKGTYGNATRTKGKVTKIKGKSGNNSGANPTSISRDDDIVARQLREAAEKETDPRLKKKLWEEYRKYKEGKL